MDKKIQKIVVSGILLNEHGQVLLAQRSMHKKIAPGAYHLPGGHVEFDERAEQALVREIWEEFDLDIIPGEVIRTFSYTINDIHTIGITFIVTVIHKIPTVINFNKNDTDSIVWLDKNDLSKYLKPSDHDYITLTKFFNR